MSIFHIDGEPRAKHKQQNASNITLYRTTILLQKHSLYSMILKYSIFTFPGLAGRFLEPVFFLSLRKKPDILKFYQVAWENGF